jgi:hypothetical protein
MGLSNGRESPGRPPMRSGWTVLDRPPIPHACVPGQTFPRVSVKPLIQHPNSRVGRIP